jgi:hypothetical protein
MPKLPQKEAVSRDNPDFEADWCRFILDEGCLFAPSLIGDHTIIYSEVSPWNKELSRPVLYVVRPRFGRLEDF